MGGGKTYECPLGEFELAGPVEGPDEAVVIHRRQWPAEKTEVRVRVGTRTSSMRVLELGCGREVWAATLEELLEEALLGEKETDDV